jgi:hypothetical protein
MRQCNDDAAGCPGYTSEVTIDVQWDADYMIRIGGYNGATGQGQLLIESLDAPPNDDCVDAIVVTAGCTDFSTIAATTDGPSHAGCTSIGGPGYAYSDVWFRWTPSFTGYAEISLCGGPGDCPGDDFFSRLAVYDGCACPVSDARLLACSTLGVSCPLNSPEVILPVQQGRCYLIRVGVASYGIYDPTGYGSLSIAPAPPPPTCPPECPPGEVSEPEACGTSVNTCGLDGSTMTPIVCGDVVCGTLSADGGAEPDKDWYEFTVSDPDGDGFTLIQATLTSPMPADIWLTGIRSGDCPTAGGATLDTASVESCGTATVTAMAPAPATYSILVWPSNWDGAPCGGVYYGNDYQLRVACDPPPNDDCFNAEFAVDGVVPFTTVGATTDGPNLPPACDETDGPNLPPACDEGYGLYFLNDVWFLWPAGCAGEVTVSLCESDYDTRLAVYEADECPGALVACNDDACGYLGYRSEVTFTTGPGAQFLIRVGGYSGTGTGLMELTCEPVVSCPWDCDGSNDGWVTVNDFFTLIAQWNQVGSSCDFGLGAVGVDVVDFFELIARWGPCP